MGVIKNCVHKSLRIRAELVVENTTETFEESIFFQVPGEHSLKGSVVDHPTDGAYNASLRSGEPILESYFKQTEIYLVHLNSEVLDQV